MPQCVVASYLNRSDTSMVNGLIGRQLQLRSDINFNPFAHELAGASPCDMNFRFYIEKLYGHLLTKASVSR